METKLIKTNDYLFLIDLEAKIEVGDYFYNTDNSTCMLADEDFKDEEKYWDYIIYFKIIAYYSSTNKNEFDLPKLPPYEKEIDLDDLADDYIMSSVERNQWGDETSFIDGFNKALELNKDKMFSVDDLAKAIEMSNIIFCDADGKDKKCYCTNEIHCSYKKTYSMNEIVQEIKYPFTFEPEFINDFIYTGDGCHIDNWVVKMIDTPKGKEVVGNYIWK